MPAQPQTGQADHSTAILWGVAGVFAGLGVAWFAFKNQIVLFYLTIKLYEVKFLSLFDHERFSELAHTISNAMLQPGAIQFNQLVTLGDGVGDIIRIPFALVLIMLAFIVYFGNQTRVFKKNYSMEELLKLEKGNWPQITPIASLNLIKTDINKGPWAMAMTPMQFCKKHRLLIEIKPERREGMTRKDWDRIDVMLKRGEASKIFALQLGPVWRGIKHLPPHAKALFAVFAARINADSKPAAELLAQLSSSSGSQLNLKGVEELINKHGNTKAVQAVIQNHAYVLTVMASMLQSARDDGVQASADFLWLKPVDRRLWYTLNTVGRQTPFVEVAGIFAHWVAEREAGKKLMVPMVEEATKALELALKEVVYQPDEADA